MLPASPTLGAPFMLSFVLLLIQSVLLRSYKAHRNGIKRMKKPKNMSQKGMDPKFIRNQKVAKRKQLALIKEGKA
jgi:large subunit ribosomal protein L29e